MGVVLLSAASLIGAVAACLHSYLGERYILRRSHFPNRQAASLVRAMWHLSTATWLGAALLFAAAPWLLDDAIRPWAVGAASLPILWGVIGNAWITGGRHFGWVAFAIVLALAAGGTLAM